MKFAKLFGPDDDQVLVQMLTVDDDFVVRVSFSPPGIGICNFQLYFEDWDACIAAFEITDEAQCRKIISGIFRDQAANS